MRRAWTAEQVRLEREFGDKLRPASVSRLPRLTEWSAFDEERHVDEVPLVRHAHLFFHDEHILHLPNDRALEILGLRQAEEKDQVKQKEQGK